MKRYRHYDKGTAVILSCFGSVVEQKLYEDLKSAMQESFEGVDFFISFSSRMVLKELAARGMEYRNLPQVLADTDRAGYRRVVVASINLFPTDEHELLVKTVEGFSRFSLSRIRHTGAIFDSSAQTSAVLKKLDDTIGREECANLYVIHGVPPLDSKGLGAVEYSHGLLEALSPANFCCSLEGAYPWSALKDRLMHDIAQRGYKKVQVVPMLLVSGNHYIKDMVGIRDELSERFESFIAPALGPSGRFNLLEFEDIPRLIRRKIFEEIEKFGC